MKLATRPKKRPMRTHRRRHVRQREQRDPPGAGEQQEREGHPDRAAVEAHSPVPEADQLHGIGGQFGPRPSDRQHVEQHVADAPARR